MKLDGGYDYRKMATKEKLKNTRSLAKYKRYYSLSKRKTRGGSHTHTSNTRKKRRAPPPFNPHSVLKL